MNTSGKKKQSFGQRNILASPYDKFWPLLDSDDAVMLTELLERLLPLAAVPKGFLTQKKLRQIFREKDKAKRKELWKQKQKSVNERSELQLQNSKCFRKSLLLGVNCVARGLEKSQVAACLISADVSPRLIVNHLIISAARSGVAVLVVPSLRKTSRTSLGVPCLAFGLHTCVAEDKENKFYPLYEMIVNLGKKFSVPEHLPIVSNSVKKQHAFKTAENSISPESETSFTKLQNTEKTDKENSSVTFTYLYRSSTKQRAFVPPRPEIKLESAHLTFIPIEKHKPYAANSQKRIRKSNFNENESEVEEENDDDDDDDDVDGSGNSDVNNFEASTDVDNLFFIDTKSSQEVEDSTVKNSESDISTVNLIPPVVKKIRGNPNKKKKKNR